MPSADEKYLVDGMGAEDYWGINSDDDSVLCKSMDFAESEDIKNNIEETNTVEKAIISLKSLLKDLLQFIILLIISCVSVACINSSGRAVDFCSTILPTVLCLHCEHIYIIYI